MSLIDAQSIVDVMKVALLTLQIPLSKLRGQCADGCSTMVGAKGEVSAKTAELLPRAFFTHFFGHALNLAVIDTVKRSPVMKDCLDCCWEVVQLVKFSP